MQRPRRAHSEIRLELTPLLDMMFLLLAFFIFAFVLMVRLDVTDIKLPPVTGGKSVENAPVVVVSLGADGTLKVDQKPVERAQVVGAIGEARAARAGSQLLIAVDEGAPSGELFKLMDELRAAGLQDLKFLRLPTKTAPDGATPAGPGQR